MKKILYSMILICLASYTPLKPAEVPDSDALGLQLIEETNLGNLERVRELITASANSNITDDAGFTALILAAKDGHTEIAKALIEADAHPNITNKEGSTALIEASTYGHQEIVEALLEAGAYPNIADNQGWTALMHATRYDMVGETEKAKAVIEALLNAGASPLLSNLKGDTVFDLAQSAAVSDEIRKIIQDAVVHNFVRKYFKRGY